MADLNSSQIGPILIAVAIVLVKLWALVKSIVMHASQNTSVEAKNKCTSD